MKTQVITLLSCILCSWAIAQQQPNTIRVNAKTVYVDPEPVYKAEISLSAAYSGSENNMMSLNQMKELFKKTLEEAGLSWKNIKEHDGLFGFETMGFKQEGVIYEYKTASVKEMKRFLNIKMPILQSLDAASSIELNSQEADKIIQMTLDKSYKKATLLAKAMKRKVGKIISISENTGSLIGKPYDTSLYYDRTPGEFYYDLMVVYELK